jgi:hypothetical protein
LALPPSKKKKKFSAWKNSNLCVSHKLSLSNPTAFSHLKKSPSSKLFHFQLLGKYFLL